MTEISPLTTLLTYDNGDIADRLREVVRDRDAFSSNTWKQLLSVMLICFTGQQKAFAAFCL